MNELALSIAAEIIEKLNKMTDFASIIISYDVFELQQLLSDVIKKELKEYKISKELT